MAKARSTRKKTATKTSASRRSKEPKWVRKRFVIDQVKLDAVRRLYGSETEQETIDQALDSILASRDIIEGLDEIRRLGGIEDIEGVFKRR